MACGPTDTPLKQWYVLRVYSKHRIPGRSIIIRQQQWHARRRWLLRHPYGHATGDYALQENAWHLAAQDAIGTFKNDKKMKDF